MTANPAKTTIGALFGGLLLAGCVASAAKPELKGSLAILVGEKP